MIFSFVELVKRILKASIGNRNIDTIDLALKAAAKEAIDEFYMKLCFIFFLNYS